MIDVHKVVKKLIGSIEPVGESHTDEKRFENLKATTLLVESLLYDIGRVAHYKNRQEGSMSMAGKYAHEFLEDQIEEIKGL